MPEGVEEEVMIDRRRSPVEPITVNPLQCTPIEVRRILAGAPFFRRLAAADVARIAAGFRQTHVAAGETIHRAGDPATRLCIVAAGMVKVARPTPDGQDVVTDILAPGEFFGSLAQLGDAVYAEDVTAQTATCLLTISTEEFQSLLERYPPVALATLEFVALRLRGAHETIEQLSAYPVEQRVAATLLKLANRLGRSEGSATLIEMPLSRQDLADMTGATVETISRVMSDLRRAGIVESGRRWISILDHERLLQVAGGENSQT
jgi:CRP-like cAMP-binding protein